jgi:hypothetical protein
MKMLEFIEKWKEKKGISKKITAFRLYLGYAFLNIPYSAGVLWLCYKKLPLSNISHTIYSRSPGFIQKYLSNKMAKMNTNTNFHNLCGILERNKLFGLDAKLFMRACIQAAVIKTVISPVTIVVRLYLAYYILSALVKTNKKTPPSPPIDI